MRVYERSEAACSVGGASGFLAQLLGFRPDVLGLLPGASAEPEQFVADARGELANPQSERIHQFFRPRSRVTLFGLTMRLVHIGLPLVVRRRLVRLFGTSTCRFLRMLCASRLRLYGACCGRRCALDALAQSAGE